LQIELFLMRCCICSKFTAGSLLKVDWAALRREAATATLEAVPHPASAPRAPAVGPCGDQR
jgi:hypothetical protein